MNATTKLQDLGQSLWLDNISRHMIDSGTLATYIADFSITGLTSNPAIFGKAIAQGSDYDEQIVRERKSGASLEDILLRLMVQDLRHAADLFAPVHESTQGRDGWVSIEVSPHFINDAKNSLDWALKLHAAMDRVNAFVKIPGTVQGARAIEEAIYLGIPINVTLLFSRGQYLGVADAYMRGIERRVLEGKDPNVRSVASFFVSRWDTAAAKAGRGGLENTLGLAIAADVWDAYRSVIASARWQTLLSAGASPQTLLWASTGVKDPKADDTVYVASLALEGTINTMPDATLQAFADHGMLDSAPLLDRVAAEAVRDAAVQGGLDLDAMAATLQREGGELFTAAWDEVLKRIDEKAAD